ncbi:MAG: hypothetical protein ACUVV1_10215 [Fimbriimonadales bacterium]
MRPTAVTVIGILGIVFGILGLCCNLFGLGAASFLPMLGEMAQQSGESIEELQPLLDNPALLRLTIVSSVLGLLLSLWMVIASILLLQMKPIGHVLLLANAVVQILWVIVRVPLEIRIGGEQISTVQSVVGAVIALVFPIVVLIVLTRPNIKAAFQRASF